MTATNPPPRRHAARVVVQRLESLQRAGVTHMKKPSPAKRLSHDSPRPLAGEGQGVRAADCETASNLGGADTNDRAAALAEVQCSVAACVRCAELAGTRTQTVFGDGNPCARLAFLGEAPGADEDRMGIPFVGRAGKLLTDIIEKGMRIRRGDVYILNILRCRPPGNRTPLPLEAANCREYLDRQLEIIHPEFICCLGAVAAQNLLGTTESIGKLRGRFFRYGDAKVMCTYHPAYVLRNPPAKRQVWEDIQMLMAEMGIDATEK